jgi:hypothetical protein
MKVDTYCKIIILLFNFIKLSNIYLFVILEIFLYFCSTVRNIK